MYVRLGVQSMQLLKSCQCTPTFGALQVPYSALILRTQIWISHFPRTWLYKYICVCTRVHQGMIMNALRSNSSAHVKSVEFIDNLLNCDSSDLSCQLFPIIKRQACRDINEEKCDNVKFFRDFKNIYKRYRIRYWTSF